MNMMALRFEYWQPALSSYNTYYFRVVYCYLVHL